MKNMLKLVTLTIVLATASSVPAQSLKDVQTSDAPLVLKAQGSFFVGGEKVEQTQGELGDLGPGGHITVNQMYVRYMVPQGADGNPPVVMVHGATLTGKSWETTPDGRMGWDEYFVRRGHPVYVPDQVGRGRSGFNQAVFNNARAGSVPAATLPRWLRFSDENVWSNFRIGTKPGQPYPDTQFPVTALDELSKQGVPDVSFGGIPTPNPTHRALADLAQPAPPVRNAGQQECARPSTFGGARKCLARPQAAVLSGESAKYLQGEMFCRKPDISTNRHMACPTSPQEAVMTKLFARTTALTAAVLIAGVGVDGAAPVTPVAPVGRVVRHVTIPAGTVLRLRVARGFGSDISRIEDPVSATLARPVVVDGRTVLREGSLASGYVSQATRPGKVKGRGTVAVRFTRITPAGTDGHYLMQTRSWVGVAPATKKKDALTIGLPAAGGAMVGGVVGGKKGAGVGALAGGGAGTAVVLTTRGKDVRVGRGALLAVRLTAPLTIAVEE